MVGEGPDVVRIEIFVGLEHRKLKRLGPLPAEPLNEFRADWLNDPVQVLRAVLAVGPDTHVHLLRSFKPVDDLCRADQDMTKLSDLLRDQICDPRDVSTGRNHKSSQTKRTDAVVHDPMCGLVDHGPRERRRAARRLQPRQSSLTVRVSAAADEDRKRIERPLSPGGGHAALQGSMGVVKTPLFVVVSGPPASGKSTLAPVLARQLGLPLIAKDTIKDALMSVTPVPDVEASRQLGRGAVAAMLAVAAESPIGAVIESNFYRSVAIDSLRRLPGGLVEIFCRCNLEVAHSRYRERAGTRHAGHFDAVRTAEELWNDEVAEPVAGGWPLMEVETNAPVDVAVVLAFVRDSLT